MGSSSVKRATSLALKRMFKSKGRSGNFKFSRYFLTRLAWSGNNRRSKPTEIPEVEGLITIFFLFILTDLQFFLSTVELIKLQLRIKK